MEPKLPKAKAAEPAAIVLPIDTSILARVKRDPITITIELTLQAVGRDGSLHLRAHLSKPRVRRERKAATAPDSTSAGSRIRPAAPA